MASNPRVFGLLEEMLDSGQTPEEVCSDCPELLSEVRQRWLDFCRIDAGVEALLPEPGTPPAADTIITPVPRFAGLPNVPGFDLEGELGRGGMGVVYKARQIALKRTVALKMLAGGHFDQAGRARFRAEAEAVARLQHPSIVQIYEIGEAEGLPFFALEFVAGGSLAQRLAGRPLPPRDAAVLVGALAETMHLAHIRNLVHRDLKPANVLLTAGADTPIGQCQPKVNDFGLARQLDADSGQTQVGVVLGTPSYMAPEQAEGMKDVGPAADTYALGAILYECLTGRPPFRGATPLETLEQVRTRDPAAPSALNRQVPRDLETICLKCLRKQPERRYSSARELAEDLGRFVRGEPVAARPVGVAERVRKWVWRRPTAAGLLAAVTLLVAVGAVGAWMLYQQRAAAQARQAQTDQEVRGILEPARLKLDEGWKAADLAKLTEARAEGRRAEDVARRGEASPSVRQEAEAFREDAIRRLERAQKNRLLVEAVMDVFFGREGSAYARDESGQLRLLARPSEDELFASAFIRWGLDVDHTTEAEIVARLGAEPEPVVQELIAALDRWTLKRRQTRPDADWRHLFRVANQLDRSERRRRVRALMVGEAPPGAEVAAGMVGAGSPWQALWELRRGHAFRRLLELRKEIEPRTESLLTVMLVADLFVAVGDAAGAEELLGRAATARPDQVLLLHRLGNLLLAYNPPRLDEAIGCYRAARGLRPQLGITLSKALLRAGRTLQADAVLRELIDQRPDNPLLWLHLANLLMMRRKFGEAEAAYRKGIALDPGLVVAHSNLGSALAEQEKYREAEAAFREAIALKPDLPEGHANLGRALSEQKKYGEAEAAYRRAIALGPNYVEAHSYLGDVLIQQGKYGEAEAACRRAIALRPNYSSAHVNLGNSLTRQKKPGEAEAAYRRAIELRPTNAEAHFNLGHLLQVQGKHGKAEAAYRKATELRPDYAEAHYNLGNCLMERRQYGEAEAVYRKASSLRPDFAEAHTNLGNALVHQGKPGEAEAAYRKAISLKPDLLEPRQSLGIVLRQQARFDEAAAALLEFDKVLPAKDSRREAARQLRRRCQRLAILDAKLPAILEGTRKPANAAEQIELAELCYLKKAYATAARFNRDAFEANPKLAEDVVAATRYDAACAAALAGCGKGKDAGILDDKERAVWRRQALEWLRLDLTRWAKTLDNSKAQQSKAKVQEKMQHWQTDDDFAGVRARDALARLPGEERKRWERFWSEVDALLRRASESE